MNILTVDTSTGLLDLSLHTTPEQSFTFTIRDGLTHTERLLPVVSILLGEAGLTPEMIGLIVCAAGPGSFTGLRIGMATAKGLRQAVGAPIVSIPTLDAMAWPFSGYPGIVLPVLDARKGRCYCARYRSGHRIGEYLDIDPADLSRLFADDTACLVTGTPLSFVSGVARFVPRSFPVVREGIGEAYAALGTRRFQESGADPDDAGPLYLRRSDAEEHRGAVR